MKRMVLVAGAAVVLIALAAGSGFCEDVEWTTWESVDGGNGHEYAVLMDKVRWSEAQAIAEDLGGYLVTITDQAEQQFVVGLIQAAEAEEPSGEDYYAIGLRQAEGASEPDGGWYWVTGETLEETGYTKWGYREPNNYRGEYLGYMVLGYFWWNDGNDYRDFRAVMEREGPPPPDDTVPPDTSLSEPDPAVLPWSADPVSVSVEGSVTDDDSGVASATLVVADEYGEADADYDVTGLLAEGNFATTVDLASTVQPGDADGRTYEISLTAIDAAGNESAPVTVSVLAPGDTTPPSAQLGAPEPSELTWSKTPVEVIISGSASDSESGVASATLGVVDEYGELSGQQEISGLLAEDGSFRTVLELTAIVRPDDIDGRTYEVTLTATDNAGNTATPASITVVAAPDGTPPTVTLDSPNPAELPWQDPETLKTVTISGTAIDGETGVQSATLIVSDEYGEFDEERDISLDVGADGFFEVTVGLSSAINGPDRDGRMYEIAVTATDAAGNVSAADAVTVIAKRPSAGNGNRPDTPPGRENKPDPPGNGNGRGNGNGPPSRGGR